MRMPTLEFPPGTQTPMPLTTPSPGRPLHPGVVYTKGISSSAAHAFNATVSAANHTLKNASHRAAAAMHNVTAALTDSSSSSSWASRPDDSAAWPAPNTTRHFLPGLNVTATQTPRGRPLIDDLNKMTTTSFSERVSQLSLVHLFAWLLLVVTMMVTTVVLLNWCLPSQQEAADAADGGDGDDGEEMRKKAGSSEFSAGSHTGGLSSGASSSSRLLASRGNLARQQFLESRKAGGAAAKDYGATSATFPAQ